MDRGCPVYTYETPWPRKVLMPAVAPAGGIIPVGKGFEIVLNGVRPESCVATYGVLWLNPEVNPLSVGAI